MAIWRDSPQIEFEGAGRSATFRTMRVGFLVAVLAASCYSPQIQNRGYACHATDVPACPDGFTCINGYCDNGSGGPPAPDLAMALDLASPAPSLPPDDLSTAPNDLAPAPHDLESLPHDLASAKPDMTTCVANGGSCNYHKDSVCCSGYCVYSTEKCGNGP